MISQKITETTIYVADDKEKLTVQTSTVTDANGYFVIFVSPLEEDDEYNLVIYTDGKVPEYKKITTLVSGEILTIPDYPFSCINNIANNR